MGRFPQERKKVELNNYIPTSSPFEGDFSLLKFAKDRHCAHMTDVTLEARMHPKQKHTLNDTYGFARMQFIGC